MQVGESWVRMTPTSCVLGGEIRQGLLQERDPAPVADGDDPQRLQLVPQPVPCLLKTMVRTQSDVPVDFG